MLSVIVTESVTWSQVLMIIAAVLFFIGALIYSGILKSIYANAIVALGLVALALSLLWV